MTITLAQGQNHALAGNSIDVVLSWPVGRGTLDPVAFILAADGKTKVDSDMVFFNQPSGAGGAVTLKNSQPSTATFNVQSNRLPVETDKVVFCVSLEDGTPAEVTIGRFDGLAVAVGSAEQLNYKPSLGSAQERALTVCEIYRRGNDFKLRAVGQGFAGGLAPLARSYGVDVADDTPPAAAPAQLATPPASVLPVSLEKKLVSLAKTDPQLVDLTKKVAVSLEKKLLPARRARFALALDISGSMDTLFRKGKIDSFVRRCLALALNLDDDGEIEVFLFGVDAHYYGAITVENYRNFTKDMRRRYDLEGGTQYGLVMELIRNHYTRKHKSDLPVYCMFLTDGGTQDVRRSETQIKEASYEPIFWQFMAIGEMPKPKSGMFRNSRVLPRGFDFLEHLDKMSGRRVDNASFFAVSDPDEPSDDELMALMMGEYPDWQKAAVIASILKPQT